MTTDKELDQAAEASAISADPKDSVCDYRTAHEIGFKAGAAYAYANPKVVAPDKWGMVFGEWWPNPVFEKSSDAFTCRSWAQDAWHACIEKIARPERMSQLAWKAASEQKQKQIEALEKLNKETEAARILWRDKEMLAQIRVLELEKRVKELQDIIDNGIAEHAKDIERRDTARTKAEALAGALDRTHTCAEGIPYDEEDCVACQALTEYRAAKGKE